jgi:hypothetical protein
LAERTGLGGPCSTWNDPLLRPPSAGVLNRPPDRLAQSAESAQSTRQPIVRNVRIVRGEDVAAEPAGGGSRWSLRPQRVLTSRGQIELLPDNVKATVPMLCQAGLRSSSGGGRPLSERGPKNRQRGPHYAMCGARTWPWSLAVAGSRRASARVSYLPPVGQQPGPLPVNWAPVAVPGGHCGPPAAYRRRSRYLHADGGSSVSVAGCRPRLQAGPPDDQNRPAERAGRPW